MGAYTNFVLLYSLFYVYGISVANRLRNLFCHSAELLLDVEFEF